MTLVESLIREVCANSETSVILVSHDVSQPLRLGLSMSRDCIDFAGLRDDRVEKKDNLSY
jgi:ABC-type transporter Mla maintaining outer membrane lipid asymmetry ATPase subunit MlaF